MWRTSFIRLDQIVIAFPLTGIVLGVLGYFVFPGRLFDLLSMAARRVVGLEKKTVVVDGIAWTYLEGGRADGETVVLLHGFGADKDNWLQWSWYLRKTHHLICPDLPGFGESATDPAGDYHTSTQAERLHRFLEALAVEQCHLVGNSMGGMIALRYALVHPDSLSTMTLIDAAGLSTTHENAFQLATQRGERQLVIRRPEDIDQLLALAMHKPPPAPARFKRVMFERAKKQEQHLDAVFDGLNNERQSPLDDQLAQIATPTLIIWGRQDQLLDVSSAEVLANGLPNNRCEIMEETGHVPMMERPKASARMQLDFMRNSRASLAGAID